MGAARHGGRVVTAAFSSVAARGVITAARDANHRQFIAHRILWEQPASMAEEVPYAHAKKLSAIDRCHGRCHGRGVRDRGTSPVTRERRDPYRTRIRQASRASASSPNEVF